MSKYLYKIPQNTKEIYMKMTMTIKTSEIKSRVVWGFSPITRIKQSKKVYSRKKVGKICLQSH